MSPQRLAAFESLNTTVGVPHVHITGSTLLNWIDPKIPLHPLFWHLSPMHQSDYLRCYLLHVHGGGYSDIKTTSKDWTQFFYHLERSDSVGAGYTEIGPNVVAPVGGRLERSLRQNFDKLIGCCAFIFHAQSDFTSLWFERLTAVLDAKADSLAQFPARAYDDRRGVRYVGGESSQYPISWFELMGDIFHPLVFEHHRRILHLDMAPSFKDYR